MYKTDYQSIITAFVVDGQKNHKFCPKEAEIFNKSLKFALRAAFKDLNFRTLKKVENQKIPDAADGKEQTTTGYLTDCLEKANFLKRFQDYFTAPVVQGEADFDAWHHETCCLFLDTLRNTGLYKEILYGKAQKIVNMMFKHLYCLEGADNWEDYFRYCHVTLDNFTLEWFKREVSSKHQRIDSWSNLVYKDKPVDTKDYLFYQKQIRLFFNTDDKAFKYANLTPFQSEFYIWPEIQLHLAAESFVFELAPDEYKGNGKTAQDNKINIRNLSVDELIIRVQETIAQYSNKH